MVCTSHPDRKVYAKGVCNSCYQKQRRLQNPELNKEHCRKYSEAHREEKREYARAHYYANTEKKKAYARDYAKRKPEINKKAQEKWRANPDNIKNERIRLREYKRKNSKKLVVANREYRRKNRERVNANARRYWAENRDRSRFHSINYQARKRGSDDGTVTTEFLNVLMSETNCYYCLRLVPRAEREMEHKKPLSRGGLHSMFNVVMACRTCNRRKQALTDQEFVKLIDCEENANLSPGSQF